MTYEINESSSKTFTVTITKVTSDDMGDTQWQWYAAVDNNGEVYSNYYRNKPTYERVLSDMYAN